MPRIAAPGRTITCESATVKGLLEQGRLRLVEKHVKNILQKLRLAPVDTDHRRVLAVLRFLEAR